MRELLQRWAELEPERCKRKTRPNQPWLEEFESFYVLLPLGEDKARFHLVATDSESRFLLDEAKMKIQWAVQEAIVSRGWSVELKYDPDCPDPQNPYDATVDSPKSGGWGFGNENFVTPLLEAYLHTLESER